MKTYIVVPDIHVPYHDLGFLKLISKAITALKPGGLIHLGDALDFWQISRFDKDIAQKDSIQDNIAAYNFILDEWERLLPANSEFHQLEGNHEFRLTRYLWNQAREIHGIVKPIQELLNLDKKRRMKCKWYPLHIWDACKIGDCVLHHGHYFNQHVAMGNMARYPVNLITGHTHRYQHVSNGERFSVTLGHGSNESETAHVPAPTSWQQAFGILHVIGSKTWFDPILVHDGRCVLYGELITSK